MIGIDLMEGSLDDGTRIHHGSAAEAGHWQSSLQWRWRPELHKNQWIFSQWPHMMTRLTVLSCGASVSTCFGREQQSGGRAVEVVC